MRRGLVKKRGKGVSSMRGKKKDKVIVHVVVNGVVVGRFKAYIAKLVDERRGVLHDGRVIEKREGRWVYEAR
jgi:uncharacterized protein YcgI (DUF1989 family)